MKPSEVGRNEQTESCAPSRIRRRKEANLWLVVSVGQLIVMIFMALLFFFFCFFNSLVGPQSQQQTDIQTPKCKQKDFRSLGVDLFAAAHRATWRAMVRVWRARQRGSLPPSSLVEPSQHTTHISTRSGGYLGWHAIAFLTVLVRLLAISCRFLRSSLLVLRSPLRSWFASQVRAEAEKNCARDKHITAQRGERRRKKAEEWLLLGRTSGDGEQS